MWKRLKNLVRGFFGLFVSGMEKRNPEAVLETEQENLREQVAKFNRGLAQHAGMCERLIGQVKRLEQEEQDLRAKTAANLRAGNRDAAGQLALRLQTVKSELEENRKQGQEAEATYKELLGARDSAIQSARDKIASLKRDLNDMKMNQAMAELNEMSAGLVTSIGGSGDTLDRLHKAIQEERDLAAGRVRVSRDSLDLTELHQQQQERKAMEDTALADFAAAEGLVIPETGGAASTPADKDMGAAEKASE